MPNLPAGKPYEAWQKRINAHARSEGIDPRTYAARVWVGIRATIKRTGELFGMKFDPSDIPPNFEETYAETMERIVSEKAQAWGVSKERFESMMRSGNAEALSALLTSSPLLAEAYRRGREPRGAAPGGDTREF